METIDLTDGFDPERIAQSWQNLSPEHSIGLASTLSFGGHFGIQLPFWSDNRLKLFIVGCYPHIRFPMNSVPTDPEEVYRALLRQTQGTGKGAKAVTRNRESILIEWKNFFRCSSRRREAALWIKPTTDSR